MIFDKNAVKEEIIEDELRMEEEMVLNAYDAASDYSTTCDPFVLSRYLENLKIEIVKETDDGMGIEFDLVKVEAPIANALRRILIAEVPTMAFEKIYLYQNTSVIQDEVLCHRIGLLPLKIDPRSFEMPSEKVIGINEHGVDCDEEPEPDPTKNLVFKFHVLCKRNRNAPTTATEPVQLYHSSSAYSSSFVWMPCGDQEAFFKHDPPKMVHDNILVAKLRPGQEIEASCHVVKGIGRDHAKFSPVATASYRLLPTIRFLKQFEGEEAERVQSSFSNGVVEIINDNGVNIAVLKDVRSDTCSRNIFRHEDLAPHVILGRKKNHFIFSVESTGALKSHELVTEACKVMERKCHLLKEEVMKALKMI